MRKRSEGQVLLITVIAIAAIVTLVLSVVSRSVIDVRTTSQQEDSVRAFAAAESGIERALVSGSVGTYSDGGELDNATYQASVDNLAEGNTSYLHPKQPLSGDDATVWLMSHNSDGELACGVGLPCYTGQSIQVCWGNDNTSASQADTPAVEVAVLYDPNPANPTLDDLAMARIAYDPNNSRRGTNFFLSPSGNNCSVQGATTEFYANIDFSTDLGINDFSAGALKFIKLRLLYNNSSAHQIGVVASAGATFPGQGKTVQSTGTSGDATRKVEVYTLYPDLPTVFDSVVYSPGGITK